MGRHFVALEEVGAAALEPVMRTHTGRPRLRWVHGEVVRTNTPSTVDVGFPQADTGRKL
jgi:hypothetical protein